jgi:two-component system, NarL family, invasion response regulator UvrY
MSKMISGTLAIVDDHALTRKTLSCRLASLGHVIILEAESGNECIAKMKGHSAPDICLIGINRPCFSSLETAIRMKRHWPEIKILFVSMLNSDDYADNLNKIGVEGFVSKRAPFAELHAALLEILKMTATSTGRFPD